MPNEESLDLLAKRLNDNGVATVLGDAEQLEDRKVTKLYSFIDPASGFPSEIFYGPKLEMRPFSPARVSRVTERRSVGLGTLSILLKIMQEALNFIGRYWGSVSPITLFGMKVKRMSLFSL